MRSIGREWRGPSVGLQLTRQAGILASRTIGSGDVPHGGQSRRQPDTPDGIYDKLLPILSNGSSNSVLSASIISPRQQSEPKGKRRIGLSLALFPAHAGDGQRDRLAHLTRTRSTPITLTAAEIQFEFGQSRTTSSSNSAFGSTGAAVRAMPNAAGLTARDSILQISERGLQPASAPDIRALFGY